MILNIQKSVVSKHIRLYRFVGLIIVVLSSKHVLIKLKAILQYDLSLMAAILDFRQSEGC